MNFMKSIPCLRASLNSGIYQTGILCYHFVLFVIILWVHAHTVLGKAACCLAHKDLLLTPWASCWPVLYLLWNLRKQEESGLSPLLWEMKLCEHSTDSVGFAVLVSFLYFLRLRKKNNIYFTQWKVWLSLLDFSIWKTVFRVLVYKVIKLMGRWTWCLVHDPSHWEECGWETMEVGNSACGEIVCSKGENDSVFMNWQWECAFERDTCYIAWFHPTSLAREGCSGSYLLEQLSLNWQGMSTALQLVTVGFLLLLWDSSLEEFLEWTLKSGIVVSSVWFKWVYSQKKPEGLHLVKIRNWWSWVVWPESRGREIKPVEASVKVKAEKNLLILGSFS